MISNLRIKTALNHLTVRPQKLEPDNSDNQKIYNVKISHKRNYLFQDAKLIKANNPTKISSHFRARLIKILPIGVAGLSRLKCLAERRNLSVVTVSQVLQTAKPASTVVIS